MKFSKITHDLSKLTHDLRMCSKQCSGAVGHCPDPPSEMVPGFPSSWGCWQSTLSMESLFWLKRAHGQTPALRD